MTLTPITLLTGFLGAGKTTLLNHILQGEHGLRLAVIVNDFGAINIDAQLVVDVDEGAINLRNGCICCTIREDLLRTVFALMQRPVPPEHILIECSGVSDPVAVATTFARPTLRALIRLDSIITVVDAEQVRDQPDYADLIADQISAADIVVLNKVDLATPNMLTGLNEWIALLVPGARVLQASYGHVPLPLLFDGAAPNRQFTEQAVPQHDAAFETWSYETDQPLVFRAVQQTFNALPTGIIRAKGLLALRESPERRTVVQLVGKRTSFARAEPWETTPPRTQIVLIGTPGATNIAEITAWFDACRFNEGATNAT